MVALRRVVVLSALLSALPAFGQSGLRLPERAVHRFGPSDAWPSGIQLVEANPEFLAVGMMLFEPCAPGG